jgi:hypothetical protein
MSYAFAAESSHLVSLLRVGTRLRRTGKSRVLPAVAQPQRSWYPTLQAALMLGTSERTLRRRIAKPHWIEGRHYRWVVRSTRRTLEINVPLALRLMECTGWS